MAPAARAWRPRPAHGARGQRPVLTLLPNGFTVREMLRSLTSTTKAAPDASCVAVAAESIIITPASGLIIGSGAAAS
jgi:hypothetical protein